MAYVHIDGRMEKIDAFCGTTLPKPIMSNGPRLMLEFRGIYSSRYSRGFKATYSFTESEFYIKSNQVNRSKYIPRSNVKGITHGFSVCTAADRTV